MMQEDAVKLVNEYALAWHDAEATARTQRLEQAWADTGEYIDPMVHITGRAALVQHIGTFKQRWPGARLELVGSVDAHHNFVRFQWKIVAADDSVMLGGMDFGEIGADGRLQRIVGFYQLDSSQTA